MDSPVTWVDWHMASLRVRELCITMLGEFMMATTFVNQDNRPIQLTFSWVPVM